MECDKRISLHYNLLNNLISRIEGKCAALTNFRNERGLQG